MKHNPATLADKMIFEDLNAVLSIYGLVLDDARYMDRYARGESCPIC
jgi:hypothetical protein